MDNKKLRKRDRALNLVKAGAKRTHRGFQKVQPVVKKVKVIVNPRNALLGFLFMSILPSCALAAPNPIPEVKDLPGWTGNLTVAIFLAGFIEESTYGACCMIPGSQWFNSRIGAPIATLSVYGCAAGAAFCHSVGWHTKGWKCMAGSASCTGYIIGAHRAAPHDPILTALRTATAPFEAAKENLPQGTA